jgi:hypothetical protein
MKAPPMSSTPPTLYEQADRLTAALREAELAMVARFRVPASVDLPDGMTLEFGKVSDDYGLRVRHEGSIPSPLGVMPLLVRVNAAFALDRLIGACENEHVAAVRRTGEAADRVERIVEELAAR